MFTGIIEELGTVEAFEPRSAGARLRVRCTRVMDDLSEGASIAVNGVCLTAVDLLGGSFAADLAPETIARSNLGDLHAGSRVNLERPVTPATRLSGHLVQGHVDATGELVSLDALGDANYWLTVSIPAALDRYLVEKGSIAIDGVSLTIASISPGESAPGRGASSKNDGRIGVTIIPHTYANTRLGSLQPGARVNLEVDVIAKHVEKLMALTEDTRR